MATDLSEVCPCGVLNLSAALEAYTILRGGTEEIHKRLRDWLFYNYLDGNIRLLHLDEPLGRRIRSVEDLGMLAGAYDRARSLRRPKTSKMDNELYFYDQKPGREAAVAAGEFMQQYFKPEAAPGKTTPGTAPVRKPLALVKELLATVEEVSEED